MGYTSMESSSRPRDHDKKQRRRRQRKTISWQTIVGAIPHWMWIIFGIAVALFWGLNGFLAMQLDDRNSGSNLVESGRSHLNLWRSLLELGPQIPGGGGDTTHTDSPPCESYGCLVMPPEYHSEQVLEAIKRLEDNVASTSNKLEFGSQRGATLTRQSNRKDPPFNQDSAVWIQPFRTARTVANKDFLIGIFDGHGADGHWTSQYFVKDVPRRIAEKFNSQQQQTTKQSIAWISQQLKSSFIEAEKEAPHNISYRGGCTASVTLRIDNLLYFANAGDSRTVLVSVNASQFQIVEMGPAPGVAQLYLTRADKANLPDEKARIEAAGGKIHIPPQNPNLSRVIVYSETFHDTIGLAMSRSLGDMEWTVKGVIPEPIVDVIDLSTYANITNDANCALFVIAASDGIWDLRLKQWYAKQIAEAFLPEGDPRKQHPLAKLKQVIEVASPKNEAQYRDDITAIVLKID